MTLQQRVKIAILEATAHMSDEWAYMPEPMVYAASEAAVRAVLTHMTVAAFEKDYSNASASESKKVAKTGAEWLAETVGADG
jgi:hypothetical protein